MKYIAICIYQLLYEKLEECHIPTCLLDALLHLMMSMCVCIIKLMQWWLSMLSAKLAPSHYLNVGDRLLLSCYDIIAWSYAINYCTLQWCHVSVMMSQITGQLSVWLTSKKHQSPYYWPFVKGKPPVTGGFPSQRASYAKIISISWCHDIDRLVQERRNSSADALELRLSWTNPSI